MADGSVSGVDEDGGEPGEEAERPVESLVITFRYHDISPEELFSYWTEQDLLTRWWPQEAETDPREGGAYHLSWPVLSLHLRGSYTTVEPGAHLGFTWQWDHEAQIPPRQVDVLLQEAYGNTWLTLTHSGYGAGEEAENERRGHLDGWMHFLSKLQDVLGARGDSLAA